MTAERVFHTLTLAVKADAESFHMEPTLYYFVLYACSVAGGIVSAGMAKDAAKTYLFRMFASSLMGFTITLTIKSFVLTEASPTAFFPITLGVSMMGWHAVKIWDAWGQKGEENPSAIVDYVLKRRSNPEDNNKHN